MGTNYYLCFKDPKFKGRIDPNTVDWFFNSDKFEILDKPDFHYSAHLCKLSCGWRALLQAHPKIKTFADYKKLLKEPDVYVLDEYDNVIEKDSLIKDIEEWTKKESNRKHMGYEGHFSSTDGYDFCETWFG